LFGKVYGNPAFEDGTHITTSRPIRSEGRIITTINGSQYELGQPSPEYIQYLKKIGRELDEVNPIKIISGPIKQYFGEGSPPCPVDCQRN